MRDNNREKERRNGKRNNKIEKERLNRKSNNKIEKERRNRKGMERERESKCVHVYACVSESEIERERETVSMYNNQFRENCQLSASFYYYFFILEVFVVEQLTRGPNCVGSNPATALIKM